MADEVDLEFAPNSYWDDPDLVKRARTTGSWAVWMSSGFGDENRPVAGGSPASLYGGEDLPKLLPNEVEIARTTLNSIHAEVTSIRARPLDGGIQYRVVGESFWDTKGSEPFALPLEYSEKPLTLRELIGFIDNVEAIQRDGMMGLVRALWDDWYSEVGDVDQAIDFVQVSSQYYSELSAYYAHEAEIWASGRRDDEEDLIDEC